MSTHKRITWAMTSRSGMILRRIPRMSDRTLFYRSSSAPGFAFARLWRCCFELPGDAESCCGSGNGTGCATVEAGVGTVETASRQLWKPMPPNSPINRVAPAMTGLCLGSRGRGESTNRLDLRKEDGACWISSKKKKNPSIWASPVSRERLGGYVIYECTSIPAGGQVFCPAIARIEWTRERLRNPLVLVKYNNDERCKPPLPPRFSAGFCLPPVMVQFDWIGIRHALSIWRGGSGLRYCRHRCFNRNERRIPAALNLYTGKQTDK